MNRRRALGLLAGALPALAAGRWARAMGDRSRVQLAWLDWGGEPSGAREGALERLAWELSLRTSVVPSFVVARPKPDSDALFDTPFLYLWGSGPLPPLGEGALRNLRRHLEFGGLLLADDGSGSRDSSFARSVRREAARLFPEAPLARLPDDHSVFRSYYLLRGVAGRVLVSDSLLGVTLEDRTPLLVSLNDLGGAWARDRLGNWLYPCSPGGENQRRQALALGVNAVLYALTVNYKQDQIHLPEILRRLRR